MALNKVIIQGRMTKTPEVSYTQGGKAVTSFSLAVDRDIKNKETGNRDCDFLDVVVWGNGAEFVCKHFVKGQMALVEGRIQPRDWTDRDGNKRRSVEVVASNVYFCGGKSENGTEAANRAGNDFHDIPDDDGEPLPF